MSNWGIMATGTIAAKLANTLHAMESEGQCLTAVASRSVEKAEAFANQYRTEKSLARAYGSYEELCEDAEVEVVYVATPNSMHFDNVKMCLEHGKHVLCEKPFTITKAEAEELFAIAKEKKCFLMEAFWVKHLPLVKELDKLLQSGTIGELKHMRVDYGYLSTGERRTRKFESKLGGGALLDIGIYTLGLLNIFMKKPPVNIQSQVRMSEFKTDWFSSLLCTYENGETANVTTTIGLKIPKEAVFYGTEGYIKLPECQNVQEIQVVMNDGTVDEIKKPFDFNGFEYQVRETSGCIKEGKMQSDVMSWADTCQFMEMLDETRKTWDMKFECEK